MLLSEVKQIAKSINNRIHPSKKTFFVKNLIIFIKSLYLGLEKLNILYVYLEKKIIVIVNGRG